MTPLRRRMIEDLRIRGLAHNTIDSYIGAVARFARYFGRSPPLLGRKEIRAFQVYLVCERKISTATLNVYTSALRFLYNVTLGKDWNLQSGYSSGRDGKRRQDPLRHSGALLRIHPVPALRIARFARSFAITYPTRPAQISASP